MNPKVMTIINRGGNANPKGHVNWYIPTPGLDAIIELLDSNPQGLKVLKTCRAFRGPANLGTVRRNANK
jgi:hypothetical protein